MQDTIRIQMMHTFMVYINERKAEGLVSKSKKGASLIQYLILNRGAPGQPLYTCAIESPPCFFAFILVQ